MPAFVKHLLRRTGLDNIKRRGSNAQHSLQLLLRESLYGLPLDLNLKIEHFHFQTSPWCQKDSHSTWFEILDFWNDRWERGLVAVKHLRFE
jgi:hypothetical protein